MVCVVGVGVRCLISCCVVGDVLFCCVVVVLLSCCVDVSVCWLLLCCFVVVL